MTTPENPTALLEYPVVIELPIQWGDQDSFRHVNNVVHIRWFESGRVAYMEQCGLAVMRQDQKVGPILASIACHYRKQLTYPDTVLVGSRVSHLGNSSITIDHAVYSRSLAAIAADGHSVVVIFDYAANRPRRVPEDLRQRIQRLEGKTF